MLIHVADDRLTLSVEQTELLLFLGGHREEPPRRGLSCSYNALLAPGLIEGYARRHGGSRVYRFTARGRRVDLRLT